MIQNLDLGERERTRLTDAAEAAAKEKDRCGRELATAERELEEWRGQWGAAIALLDLSDTLGCSLDDFFGDKTLARKRVTGWLVHKKKDQTVAKAGKRAGKAEVEIQSLLPDEGKTKRVAPHLLRLAPGAEDTRPFFDHKGPEFGYILSGLLKIVVEQEEIVLRKGDSIYLEDQVLARWRNEGTSRVELIWVLCG